jgi:predicted DNA-binding antitoxin AbrB/MazE fold protein
MADLTVIYEAGVLRPTNPLTLREGQRLKIRILEIHSPDISLAEALAPLIASNALIEPMTDQSNSDSN